MANWTATSLEISLEPILEQEAFLKNPEIAPGPVGVNSMRVWDRSVDAEFKGNAKRFCPKKHIKLLKLQTAFALNNNSKTNIANLYR